MIVHDKDKHWQNGEREIRSMNDAQKYSGNIATRKKVIVLPKMLK